MTSIQFIPILYLVSSLSITSFLYYIYDRCRTRKTLLLGIVGNAGDGKDTVVKYMERKYRFKSYALSDNIKKIGEILGFTNTEMYGTQKQKVTINNFWDISGREFLQGFGDMCNKAITEYIPRLKLDGWNIWIKSMERYYEQECKGKYNLVISDVRYISEAEKIREMGGFLVKLVRYDSENEQKQKSIEIMGGYKKLSLHPSETESRDINCHYTLYNTSTINNLYCEIDKLILILPGLKKKAI